MKRGTWSASGLFLALLALVVITPLSLGAGMPDYQLLQNPGVEMYGPVYAQFEDLGCRVAVDWDAFSQKAPDPCLADTRDFADSSLGSGWVERIEGDTSQIIVATEPYTAGLRQQVGGLIPGEGYGFHSAMLTIYQTSAPPAVDNTMFKQVGIDPTGGTDPASPEIVWSSPDGHDEGPWDIDSMTAAYAEAPTVTVYIRITSPLPSGGLPLMNLSFLDSAILAQTASVSASSPALSEQTTFEVIWDNAVPSPGGLIRWYDVQWMDEADGIWHDWFTLTEEVAASFTGDLGHAYRFRARAWQRYPNGAHLFSPYREEGDTRTVVGGSAELRGLVLTNQGRPLMGATVAISGTGFSGSTDPQGRVSLSLGLLPGPQTVTVERVGWLAPSPVYSITFGLTETVPLTWTLRSLDDVVVNGEFEAGLGAWSWAPIAPEVVTAPVHTGRGALALTTGATVSVPVTGSVAVSQTVVVTDSWEPVLSFWYLPEQAGEGDRLNVVLTIVTETVTGTWPISATTAPLTNTEPVTTVVPITTTRVLTPALDSYGWSRFWCYAGLPRAALTGTLTVEFRTWNEGVGDPVVVYLDEVSLGARAGGRYAVYLPVVGRGW
ncbi:MAG: hypothetical protein JXA93_04665 [Anaerolineae bacterium]|nr:hypothetical protein [Anaerolineae bacterium]